MKISMQVVLEELSVHASVSEYQIDNETDFIDRILFADASTSMEDGALYILSPDIEWPLSDANLNAAVIYTGELPKSIMKNNLNYIVLHGNISPELVLNHLQTVFSRLNAWEREAYETLVSGKGLQALFNSALRILHNPVYLHDRDYKIIVYAEDHSNPVMGKTYEFLRAGKMPPQAVFGLTKSPDFEKTFEAHGTRYWKKTSIYPDEYNYIYCNVRNGTDFVGRIFVDERVRPFRYADYSILEKLAQITSQIFRANNAFQSGHQDQLKCLVEDLLAGRRVSAQQLASELQEMGWSTPQQYLCFVIRVKENTLKCNAADSICSLLEQQVKKCIALLYEQHIVGFFAFDDQRPVQAMLEAQIEPVFTDFRLKAGFSLVFSDLLDIAKSYKQANAALKLGSRLKPDALTYFFSDYTFDYMIGQLMANMDSSSLFPEGLRQLLQYDQEHDVDYALTLRAYLENNCSPAQTAKALFIHRSTLLYRLEKIQEITRDDFDDNRTRLHYMLAFQMLTLEQQHHTV